MDLDALYQGSGQDSNIDPDLLKAVNQVESNFNPKAISTKGAVGIAQILPSTAALYGVKDPELLKDPKVAIPLQARILSDNLQHYDGNVEKAILAYHGSYDESQWGPKTHAYLNNVSNVFQQIKAQRTQNANGSTSASQGDALTSFLAQSNQGGAQPAQENTSNATAQGASQQDALTSFLANSAPQADNATVQDTGSPTINISGGTVKAEDPAAVKAETDALAAATKTRVDAYYADPKNRAADPEGYQQYLKLYGQPKQPPQPQVGNSILDDLHDLQVGGMRGALNAMDGLSETAAKAYDWVNHALGGNSHAYDKAHATNQATQKDWTPLYNTQNMGNMGVKAGELEASLPVTELKVMKGVTLLPRAINGLVQGGVAGAMNSSTGEDGPFASTVKGGLLGAGANAILPPVLNKAIGLGAPYAQRMGQSIQRMMPEAEAPAANMAQRIEPTLVPPAAPPQVIRSARPPAPAAIRANPARQAAQEAESAIPATASVAEVPNQEIEQQVADNTPAHLTAEQAQRKAEMEAVGAKPTVGQITRNFEDQQVERELAKDNQAGSPLRANDQSNNRALLNHTEGLIDETAGQAGTADHAEAWKQVTDALQKGKDTLKAKVDAMYQAARQSAGDAKVINLQPMLQALKGLKPEFLASTEGTALMKGVQAQLKQFGVKMGKGNQMLTVDEAENMRQFLNSVSSYENSRLINKVKDALDEVVNQSGNGGVFTEARAARRLLGQQYENNQALLDVLGQKKGMADRVVPFDKGLQKYVTGSGSVDHLKVLVERLKSLGTPEANQALQSLKAATINAAYQKAIASAATNELGDPVFSGAAFKKALDGIGMRKLNVIFNNQELGKLGTLTRAGVNLTTSVPGAVNHSNTNSAAWNTIARVAHHIPVARQALGAWHVIQEGVAANANKMAVQRALNPDQALQEGLRQAMHRQQAEQLAKTPAGNPASIVNMLIR